MLEVSGLSDRVVMVTGGASGIGAGIASAFAQAGAIVVVADINAEMAHDAAKRLTENGSRALAVELNVTDPQSIDDAFSQIEVSVGDVDVLVNNAGISKVKPLQEITTDEWDAVIDVNLKGVFLVTRRALPKMIGRSSGRIIGISSMAGKEGLPNLSHYCASKFGVIGLTQSLAKEVASYGITVNAVCPGVVRTPLWDDSDKGILNQLDGEKGWQEFVGGIPLGRPQMPIDIGYACLFLASDLAHNITGESLNVSGGQQVH